MIQTKRGIGTEYTNGRAFECKKILEWIEKRIEGEVLPRQYRPGTPQAEGYVRAYREFHQSVLIEAQRLGVGNE